MKNILIRCTALAVLLLVSSVSFANSGKKVANEFEIIPVEDLRLGNSIEKVWKISYSEAETPVTIVLRSVGEVKEYIVRSEFFDVLYVLDKEGFGIRKMPASLKEVPGKITSRVLNKEQLKNQRILTPHKISETYALELIASYLPDLVNEDYKHLLYY
jgi:hypothetical protein